MAKIITVPATTAPAGAPRILRTPGVPGYAARFIASHLDAPAGSVISQWPSVGGSVPGDMQVLSGATSTVTVQVENGKKHLHSPGNALGGGRLIGPHTTQRPVTVAAIIRSGPAVERSIGITGTFVTRNGSGFYQGTSGSMAAYTSESSGGWMFVLLAQEADNKFVIRAGASESQSTGGSAAATSYGGVYFGASEAGDVSEVREIIYWPRMLNLAERSAVHDYMRSRYPEIV